MTDSELALLTRTIDELNESTADLAARAAEQTKVQYELREELNAVHRKLPTFVPRSRFRWVIGTVVVAMAVLLVVGIGFRRRDDAALRDRRAQIAAEQEQDRQNLIRGCERSNDQRATLTQIIDLALSQTTMPPGLPPELQDIYRTAQARTMAKRDELLALPGVQQVDCQAQFPPPPKPKA